MVPVSFLCCFGQLPRKEIPIAWSILLYTEEVSEPYAKEEIGKTWQQRKYPSPYFSCFLGNFLWVFKGFFHSLFPSLGFHPKLFSLTVINSQAWVTGSQHYRKSPPLWMTVKSVFSSLGWSHISGPGPTVICRKRSNRNLRGPMTAAPTGLHSGNPLLFLARSFHHSARSRPTADDTGNWGVSGPSVWVIRAPQVKVRVWRPTSALSPWGPAPTPPTVTDIYLILCPLATGTVFYKLWIRRYMQSRIQHLCYPLWPLPLSAGRLLMSIWGSSPGCAIRTPKKCLNLALV